MKMLALQLGECCLASDLSALIHQKRDLELGKITKKTTNVSKIKAESDYIDKLKNSEKIESDTEKEPSGKIASGERHNQFKNQLHKKPVLQKEIKDDTKQSLTLNNILDETKEFKNNFIFSMDCNVMNTSLDRVYKNFLKIREILANFILSCLKEYAIDEYNLIKINTNLIYCYISLPSFEQNRRKLERKVNIPFILENREPRTYGQL